MTSDSSGKYSVKKIMGYLLPFFLTVLFLFFAFKDVELDKIKLALENVSILAAFAFFFFFLLSHFLRAVRWKYILNSVKPDAKLGYLFAATMVGYGINCVVPRLGEIYRSLFLGKWESISRSSVLGTIIVERVIDILSLGFSVLISVMIFNGNLYQQVEWLQFSIYFMFAAMFTIVLILFLVVKFKERFYNSILKIVNRISNRMAIKLAEIFKTLTSGFASLQGKRNIFFTLLYTVLIMFVYGFNAYVGFYMLRMDELQEVYLGMGWILMTISAFGIIIPTPGGTGSYHLITISVLTGLFGFSATISSAYAILTHFISYSTFIVLLFVIVSIVNKYRAKIGYKKETFLSVFKSSEGEKNEF